MKTEKEKPTKEEKEEIVKCKSCRNSFPKNKCTKVYKIDKKVEEESSFLCPKCLIAFRNNLLLLAA